MGGGNYFCGVSCSDDLSVIVLNERIGISRADYNYLQSIYHNSVCIGKYEYNDLLRDTDVSPSGRILISQKEGTAWVRTGVPIVVQVL